MRRIDSPGRSFDSDQKGGELRLDRQLEQVNSTTEELTQAPDALLRETEIRPSETPLGCRVSWLVLEWGLRMSLSETCHGALRTLRRRAEASINALPPYSELGLFLDATEIHENPMVKDHLARTIESAESGGGYVRRPTNC
jgi:hypothetical protein